MMRELNSVIWMSCKDLRHDMRMTVCLVLTVAAIALPLLLFFGLKNGVVEVMRGRMINDPSFMEVIPQGASTLDAAWFERWKNNPHVGFLVPKTRELGVGGTFSSLTQAGKSVKADMQPTGDGDWLLQSYRMQIPSEGACVLTTSLAQKLSVKQNDNIEVKISRQKKGGGLESASLELKVIDILPQQASGRDMAFVPLIQLERMEAYRDGFGVEAYGWAGEKPLAYPVFYEALLYTREVLSPIITAQLRQRTGFAKISETPDFAVDGWHVLLLQAGNNPLSLFKVQELRNILRGQEMAFIPIAGQGGNALNLTLVNFNAEQSIKQTTGLKLLSSPLWVSDTWQGFKTPDAWPTKNWQDIQEIPAAILLSPDMAAKFSSHKALALIKTDEGATISIPLHILPHENVLPDTAIAAPGLITRLNLLNTRPLEVADKTNVVELGQSISILLGRQNYSRFRMYARSLDDVAPLAAQLEKGGIIVKTRVADIERVRKMDQYLSLILGLIAGAAVIGGAICLLASLYASVERKRRALAVLRLLGIHGTSLCAFPLTAGLMMTGMGMLLSLFLFHGLGAYMNFLAQDFILPGEVLCRLGFEQQLWAIAFALLASILAGLAAAIRLLKIEAAEGLRDE